ncbi:MAG: prepilin peptidase [Alphaproteobacteria bacterium]|jgi:Flp pilus assembly protein protease CpaA|nr:A24 family peptidase [Alphaproteobacteria bacterium]
MVEDILGGFFILTALYLIYIDIKTYSLPNWGVSFVALLGIIYIMNGDASMMNAFVSSILLMGLMMTLKALCEKKSKVPILGGGDIKLFGALGLWLTPQDLPYFLMGVGGAGILWAFLWQRVVQKRIFPFAPPIYAGYGILCIARVCKWL